MAGRSLSPIVIEAEIERIRSLGLEALRSEWRAMYGASPPAGLTKDIMARMMAYRLQEAAPQTGARFAGPRRIPRVWPRERGACGDRAALDAAQRPQRQGHPAYTICACSSVDDARDA
jgi:hypothetical protein